MSRVPEHLTEEASEIKEIALALMSGDPDRIIHSGYLDKEDFYDSDGNRLEDFDETFDQWFGNDVTQGSTEFMSAYSLDKLNRITNEDYMYLSDNNYDTAYTSITLRKGDNLNGELVISSDNEYFIQITDKENKMLSKESGIFSKDYKNQEEVIAYEGKFFEIIDQYAEDQEGTTLSEIIPARTIEEYSYLYKNAEIDNFDSEESYKEFKLEQIRAIDNFDFTERSQYATVRNLIDATEYENHMVIHHDGYDRSFIAEVDGNVFFYEQIGTDLLNQQKTFKFVEEGESFTFHGQEAIAGDDILRAVRMGILTDFDNVKENHNEMKQQPEPEPEVKKTRTRKPGM